MNHPRYGAPPMGPQPRTRRNVGARGDTLPGSPPDGAGAPQLPAPPAHVRFAKGAGRDRILAKKDKTSRGRRLLQRAISIGEEDAGAARVRRGQEMAGHGNAALQDGDIVAFYSTERLMYWTCEDSTITSGCAIKLKPRGRQLGEGNKFEVVMHDAPSSGAFALKSLYNNKLIAPNFRGRLHCDAEQACDGVALDEGTLFTATHKERTAQQTATIIRHHGTITPFVRIMSVKQRRWLWTVDSLLHRDPRIALVGAFESVGKFYKVRDCCSARASPARLAGAEAAIARATHTTSHTSTPHSLHGLHAALLPAAHFRRPRIED